MLLPRVRCHKSCVNRIRTDSAIAGQDYEVVEFTRNPNGTTWIRLFGMTDVFDLNNFNVLPDEAPDEAPMDSTRTQFYAADQLAGQF